MRRLTALLAGAALALAPATADAQGQKRLMLRQRAASVTPPDPPTASDVVIPGAFPPLDYGRRHASWEHSSGPGYQGDDYLTAFGGLQPAIGSWVVPQFLTIETTTRVGAIFRHLPTAAEWNGGAGVTSNIARVEFQCDGGDTFSITSETYHADTGVTASHFRVTDAFLDGLHECRATGVPTTGLPKILQGDKASGRLNAGSLFFFTNFHNGADRVIRYVDDSGTDVVGCGTSTGNACLTIRQARRQIAFANSGSYTSGDVGNGRICLGAGTYALNNVSESYVYTAKNRYLEIDSCGLGGTKSNVFISAGTSQHLNVEKINFRNLTMIYPPATDGGLVYFKAGVYKASNPDYRDPIIYVENVALVGGGKGVRNGGPTGPDWNGGNYRRRSQFSNFLSAGPGSASILVSIDKNGADAYSGARLVLSSTVTNLTRDTFATANLAAGSNLLTNIVDPQGNVTLGFNVYNCSPSTYVIARDGDTATLAANCGVTGTAVTLQTGSHTDVAQYPSGVITDVMMIGNGFGPNDAQGLFLQTDIFGLWLEGNLWDNAGTGSNNLFKGNGRTLTNVGWVGESWAGSFTVTDPDLIGVDFAITNTTCTDDGLKEATGLTFRNSETCH